MSNPWGLLALLGIPAILLIHFLQRKAKELPCSTLFLLKQTQKESVNSRKFDKLVSSVPLWMQLLMVLLATVLIIELRYISEKSTQRIAIVLDSSASMSVFKKQALSKILEQVPKLQSTAPNLELWVLDSDISKDRIYHGDSLGQLQTEIEKWQPNSSIENGHHSLRVARSLAGNNGAVIYITDSAVQSIPYNATVHSIGTPTENVGFTGITFENSSEELIWKASIKNYSKQPSYRQWSLLTDQKEQTQARDISLLPGELKVISGPLPKDRKRIQLVLSDDAFPHDHLLPIINPAPKILNLFNQCSPSFSKFTTKITTQFEGLSTATDAGSADLLLISQNHNEKEFGLKSAIVFLENQETSTHYLASDITTNDHPLTEGLNWSSLLISKETRFTATALDTPLVWAGKVPIIFLREVPIGLRDIRSQLIFNFNILTSNADQQEAIALLLYRFINQQRKNKKVLLQQITELRQPLNIVKDREGSKITTEYINLTGKVISSEKHSPKHEINAPGTIGFYSIKQDDNYLLHASNYFADTREADLSTCASGLLEAQIHTSAVDLQSNTDTLWRLWTLLILFAMLLTLFFSKNTTAS